MTPTMSEYFEAWKSSRFVAGAQVGGDACSSPPRACRTSPASSTASCWSTTASSRRSPRPTREQAKQTGSDLKGCTQFAVELRDEEAGGKKFTAAEADTLGSDAQDRAEAIAGQVSQAAGQLGIKLEN